MSTGEFFATVWPRLLIWDAGRYLVAGGLLAAVVAWVATTRWRVRRIQTRRATARDYRREIVASLRTCLIFSLIGVGIGIAQRIGVLRHPPTFPGYGLSFVYFAAMMIGQDAYFYWTHRAMHRPALFRRMHRLHHQSVTPTPFAAYAFSISEAVVQALFVVLWVAVVPTPQAIVLLFMLTMIFRNAWGHSGYELHPAGMAEHPVFGRLTTTLHHDLHHSGDFDCNYGLWFTWWDRWLGTEHPQYRARYRALTGPSSATAPITASSPAE